MSRTGNLFIDVFSFVVIFMPLVPVCIVFLQKKYTEDALNFLMILCLLYFIESILVSFPGLSWENRSIIGNIFSVIEMMIILQLLKTILPAKIKQSITFFIV